ncbi:MAG: hypothetical protein KC449_09640 [Anaerolineales bacterium]|nr:hypothetical protein [Anaerolineales bacterium]
MNNTLAPRPAANGRITNQTNIDALIATLPKWLAYLVGAFPAAQTNKMTFLAYETTFAEVDKSLMLTAVQTVAKQHKYSTFPSIAEIEQAVSTFTQRLELETASERGRAFQIRNLQKQRQLLLERAYNGEVEPALWESLIKEYGAIGFVVNADWARHKLAQIVEGINKPS